MLGQLVVSEKKKSRYQIVKLMLIHLVLYFMHVLLIVAVSSFFYGCFNFPTHTVVSVKFLLTTEICCIIQRVHQNDSFFLVFCLFIIIIRSIRFLTIRLCRQLTSGLFYKTFNLHDTLVIIIVSQVKRIYSAFQSVVCLQQNIFSSQEIFDS